MFERFWRKQVIRPSLNSEVDLAVTEQKAVLAKDPNNANAYFALGTLTQFQHDVDQAIQYFTKSIELDASAYAPHLSLGRIYAVRGDYDAAWKHARIAESLGARDLVEMLERYPNLK